MKKLLSLLLCFCLVGVCGISYSSAAQETLSNGNYSSESKIEDKTYITEFKNLQALRSTGHRSLRSDRDTAIAMWKAIGYTEDQIQAIPEEHLLESLDFTEAHREETYQKQLLNGSTVALTREQCLEEVESINRFEASLSDEQSIIYNKWKALEDKSGEEAVQLKNQLPASLFRSNNDLYFSSDGYMKITTSAMAVSGPVSGQRYYLLSARAEWLKMPAMRQEDCLALGTTASVDHDYDYYGYSHYDCECTGKINYHTPKHDNYHCYAYKNWPSDKSHLSSLNICGLALWHDVEGMKCTFPGGMHTVVKDTCESYICYRVSIKNINAGVQAKYGHKYFGPSGVTVALGGGASGPSISFSVNWTSQVTTYAGNAFTLYW